MGKHGDLTDEEIAFWPRVLGDDPFRDEHRVIVRAVAEIRRHRAVQTASAERVREVVRLIAQEEIAGEGPWRGQPSMHDYCDACSKDLCEKCLADGRCRESVTRKHVREES